MTATSYENQVAILADLWTNYREEEAFAELFEFADLSFPLAFALFHGMIDTTEAVQNLVGETFRLLLEVLSIVEDEGFQNLDEVFATAGGIGD